MSAVLKFAARRGWCEFRPIERPRQPKGRTRWFRPAEAERLSEALYLDWADVDLTKRRVWFLDTKNGESRGVPLNERVVLELANLPHRKGAVFRRPDGAPYERRLGGGGQIATAWTGVCRRAWFAKKAVIRRRNGRKATVWRPFYSPHDCRHSWATWFYSETRDLRALMELGGWKSERMVMRYTHVNPDHLRTQIDALPCEKSGKRAAER